MLNKLKNSGRGELEYSEEGKENERGNDVCEGRPHLLHGRERATPLTQAMQDNKNGEPQCKFSCVERGSDLWWHLEEAEAREAFGAGVVTPPM